MNFLFAMQERLALKIKNLKINENQNSILEFHFSPQMNY
jgi:hypothetical protein